MSADPKQRGHGPRVDEGREADRGRSAGHRSVRRTLRRTPVAGPACPAGPAGAGPSGGVRGRDSSRGSVVHRARTPDRRGPLGGLLWPRGTPGATGRRIGPTRRRVGPTGRRAGGRHPAALVRAGPIRPTLADHPDHRGTRLGARSTGSGGRAGLAHRCRVRCRLGSGRATASAATTAGWVSGLRCPGGRTPNGPPDRRSRTVRDHPARARAVREPALPVIRAPVAAGRAGPI